MTSPTTDTRIEPEISLVERIALDAIRVRDRGRKVTRVRISLADFDDFVAQTGAKTEQDGSVRFLTLLCPVGAIRVERSSDVFARGSFWINEGPIDPTGNPQATPGG